MTALWRNAPTYFSLVALALLTGGHTLSAAEVAPRDVYTAPDMSAYDCSTLDKALQRRTLHIGQVIEGTYYEWDQTYVARTAEEAAPTSIACISLLRPDARTLAARRRWTSCAGLQVLGSRLRAPTPT